MINNTTVRKVLILIVFALLLRVFNFSFPAFTTDEARIAFRGYVLSTNGVDELGRRFPYLFNSLNDYQLPLTSYISALGARVFGKSELGARAPFIIIGLILVLLTYKVSTQLSKETSLRILSAFIVATSPALIFSSKVPNELVVVTTLLLLLFYLLNKERFNLITILFTMILLFFTSKFSWFIVTPFVIYTVFVYRNTLDIKEKLRLSLISLALTILAFVLFLQVPQGARSLSENNLTLFSDTSIIDGINWIRGQGMKSGWPPFLEQILINKSHFFISVSLHWLSNIQPAVLFSEFDKNGNLGFINMGTFPKVTIIPALIGTMFLVREKRSKLLLYPVIISLPAALIYPQFCPQIVILTLPFISFIIAFGFLRIKRIIGRLIIIVMIIELLVNFFFLSPQIKLTDELRPHWIKPILQDVFKMSNTDQVLISDDITQDPVSFIEWYTPFNSQEISQDLPYPYRFRQTNLGNIKLIGFSNSFKECDIEKKTYMFLTKRDLDRVKKISAYNVIRNYSNSRGQIIVYYITEEGACLE